MATTLRDMTPEHLGEDANDDDLAEFRFYVEKIMARDGLSERDAISAVWGGGDWISAANRLGLTD